MEFVHSEITVTYNDTEDTWEFQLRGRNRTAPSPAKAKEFIDKEPAPSKSVPFPKFDAYLIQRGSPQYSKVQVTGIGDANYRGASTFWIYAATNKGLRSNGREKVEGDRLVVISLENGSILEEIRNCHDTANQLIQKAHSLQGTLNRIKIPDGL